ncbi:hypothetical protein [Hyphomicrobium sp. 1Nfss2.1]|uniref:hypothetical protein n=1 Tax=Hyphomicrobium sp. 1Nfss2.1 TaxID=3413936 RepID=UPI003C7C7395
MGAATMPPLLQPVNAAEAVPRYDPGSYCDEVAGFGGSYSELTRDGCMDMEQSAYDALKTQWSELSPRIREYCDEVARFGGKGSYLTLQGCVQMEQGAAARNRDRAFKF